MQAFHTFLGGNDMMAYLAMMAPRLVELRRVLKPTGSLYLHCDPTASHYLKLLCDAVLGKDNFRNEIIWKRTNAHKHAANRLLPNPRHHPPLLKDATTTSGTTKSYDEHTRENTSRSITATRDPDGRRYHARQT